MTLTAAQQHLIADVARSQVGEIAPHEAALFRATSEAYFTRSKDPQSMQPGDGPMLGFGAGGAVTFLTPVLLAIATEVVMFLASELSKQLKAESGDAITALIKRLFKPLRNKIEASEASETPKTVVSTEPPPLSKPQLAQIRALAYEKARQFNLAEDQAGLLADSMVGNLVVA